MLPDEYPTVVAAKMVREEFQSSGNSDSGIKVYQYWGAKGLDKDGVGKWDADDVGKVKWDKDFDLANN